jgi:hypothetical protein
MPDPITLVMAAVEIVSKAGMSEVGKQGALELIEKFRSTIKARFQGDAKAEKAIQAIEQDGSQRALGKFRTYLDDAMEEDPTFASEIQHLAQQIINIQNQNTTHLTNKISTMAVNRMSTMDATKRYFTSHRIN